MSGAIEVVGLVLAILGIAGKITVMADKAQRNTEKCKLLNEHVRMITLLLTELQKHITSDLWTKTLLENLNDALIDGMALVQSCQEKRTWPSRYFKTQKKAKKFDALGLRISKILEQFHLANMILIVTINNGRFFENVLRTLHQNGAFKGLNENVQEELNSSITRLTNTENMSADAKELLESIKKAIPYSSGSSGAQRGKKASSTSDYLTVDIVDLTKRIRQQAQMNSGGDVQRLAHLVQQIANIIEHPDTSQILLDPNTRPTLEELKQDLERISDNIVWYNGKEHSKVKRVMLCGPGNSDELLKDAYKIEYYIQVLVIASRQLYERNYMRWMNTDIF